MMTVFNEPGPAQTAREKFAHIPKSLTDAQMARAKLEEQLEVLSEKEKVATVVAREFRTLQAHRDALAKTIAVAEEQRAGFVKSLEGACEGILQRIGEPAAEGLLIGQASVMASWREVLIHIKSFVKIRGAEIGVIEVELKAFALKHGIEYPSK